ncbi:hypothetical protein [Chitinasiproducens palmae]|uniref:Uncharacterized protein n=1 Tax=Chitinasiproducens palmae TaxID=1770053 RepID=A0A1H2PVT8_9BURK|nr:hypothetical protein [Chitinasiproducens palmae]SDV51440.1 hypothetical protein SAMN05216551_11746 [Chitinasiproducens palmae]
MKRLALFCAIVLHAGIGATIASAEPTHAQAASAHRALPPIPPAPAATAERHARAIDADDSDGTPFIVRTRSERTADGAIERWHTIELPVVESPSAGLHPVGNVAI